MLSIVRLIAILLVACLLNAAPGCEVFLRFMMPFVFVSMSEVEKVPAYEEYVPMETLPIQDETGSEELVADKLSEERAWELLERTNSATAYLKYYFADRDLIDEENVYDFTPAIDPDTEYPCVSVQGVSDYEDLVSLLRDDFTQRYVQERFMRGLYWDAQNEEYIMEGQWFEGWRQEGVYLLDNWASGSVGLLEDTLQIAKTGEDTYKISAEMEYDLGRFYCDVVCEDGVYKVAQSHEGTGQPDYGTAKVLLYRSENGRRWLLYHFSTDELVNWEDTLTLDVMEGHEGSQMVDAYTVQGINTWEDLSQALSVYFSEDMVEFYHQESYTLGNRTFYNGDWFEENGKIYFMPNWGMGTLVTDYQTTQIREVGENHWEITADAEYETTSSCQVVWDEEAGRYRIDG